MREPNFPTEILRLGFNFITSYYGPVQNVTKTNSYGDALQGNMGEDAMYAVATVIQIQNIRLI